MLKMISWTMGDLPHRAFRVVHLTPKGSCDFARYKNRMLVVGGHDGAKHLKLFSGLTCLFWDFFERSYR